jgi:adenylate cyclase
VIDWADRGDARLHSTFAGKPVLLGFILPFEDRKSIPVALAALEPGNHLVPGVFVHAQILRNMLNGGLVQAAPALLIALLILAGAGFWLLPASNGARLAMLGFLITLPVMAVLALRTHQTFIPVLAPILAAILGAGARHVQAAASQARERALLRNAFGGYVSPQVMSAILAGSVHPGLEGERRQVAILFSDIRDFTRRSEAMTPERLIDMLNQYFTEMTDVVHDNDGTVDKFIGDGLMAFFGAPQQLENPAQRAVEAALQMLKRLESLNARLVAQGHEALRIGIGIHVGEVIIGHVGSASRHEYTAIGDAVNTASRVEGLTKDAGYPLLVTLPVYEALPQKAGFSDLGSREVRGRSAIDVYGHAGHSTSISTPPAAKQ